MNCQLVISNPGNDGIGNILKGFISALSINENSVIKPNPNYVFGNYDTILEDIHIYSDKGQPIENVGTCRLLVLKEEEQLQDNIENEFQIFNGIENPKFTHLFSSKLIDSNFDPDKVHTIIKQRIFSIIDKIHFKPIVLDTVNNIHHNFKNNISLGISIRTWKCHHEHDIYRNYSFEVYKNKIEEVLHIHPEINKIIISIDNPDYLNVYIELFNKLGIEYIILEKGDNINHLQYALSKALVLGKCNYFIGNRISTFSELVFWFSKHQTKVFTVF